MAPGLVLGIPFSFHHHPSPAPSVHPPTHERLSGHSKGFSASLISSAQVKGFWVCEP